MIALLVLGVLILGTLIGSFLNVVIYRYNTGLSPSSGRSQCFVCGKKLSWYELIPVVSFCIQKGRCRTCHAKISWQYPFVEIVTSILFLGVVYRQSSLYDIFSLYPHGIFYLVILGVYYACIMSLLVVIAVYDIRHKIIPDALVYTFAGLALLKLFVFTYLFALPLDTVDILNLLAPLILSAPFAFLWFISKGMWIGFGDAKLAFGIGALLGLPLGVSAIMIGFWVGALYGLLRIGISKFFPSYVGEVVQFNSEVPFAPFLIIGVCVALFTQVDVLGLMQLFSL